MDKITLLRSNAEPHGAIQRTILYFYDIQGSPGGVIQDSLGNTIRPQRSTDLSADALRYTAQTDKDDIDNGLAGFEVLTRLQLAGQSIADFTVRVLADHTAREAFFIQQERDRFAQAGQGAN